MITTTLTALALTAGASLQALCERVDNNAYLAIWKTEAGFEVATSGDLTFGDVAINVTPEMITLESAGSWHKIVIPKGKNIVEIEGADFDCDY